MDRLVFGILAHGGHRHVHPQGEHADAADQQQSAEEKEDDGPWGQRRDGHAQQQNDGCDGQDRGQGFLDLFHELRIDPHGHAPFPPPFPGGGCFLCFLYISYQKIRGEVQKNFCFLTESLDFSPNPSLPEKIVI